MAGLRILLVTALVAQHGCSYAFMDRPPVAVRPGDTFPGCTTSDVFGYLDLGGAAGSVLGSVLIYSGVAKADTGDSMMPTKRELTTFEKEFFGTFALVEGAVYALAAYRGFTLAKRCRAIQNTAPLPAPSAAPALPISAPPAPATPEGAAP